MTVNTEPKGFGFCDYFHNGRKHTAHRTRLKLILNPILRTIQFWSKEPYVIASHVDLKNKRFLGYAFKRVGFFN